MGPNQGTVRPHHLGHAVYHRHCGGLRNIEETEPPPRVGRLQALVANLNRGKTMESLGPFPWLKILQKRAGQLENSLQLVNLGLRQIDGIKKPLLAPALPCCAPLWTNRSLLRKDKS